MAVTRLFGYFAVLVLSYISPFCVSAQTTPFFTGEFWVELEPVVRFEEIDTSSAEDQLKALLEEARFVFSAMLYGLEFRYVPLDLRRNVAEEFEIQLLAEIEWSDPRLSVVSSRYQNGRRYVHLRYAPNEEQSGWMRFWESNVHTVSSGYGEGNVFRGQEEKLEAIRNALKESIRGYLRPRENNKPREISGLAAFSSVPGVVIDSGIYRAKVDVKLDIRSVVPYKVY
jgi:hypothetical protein